MGKTTLFNKPGKKLTKSLWICLKLFIVPEHLGNLNNEV